MTIQSFHPPVRTLMGPGPSDVNPRILEAMSRPTIGHLDPVFVDMMDEMKDPAALCLPDRERADHAGLRAGFGRYGNLFRQSGRAR